MADIIKIQEQHTAGPQLIGFDYQFYYFIYLALGLKLGESIGFEVKDDIHIDKPDGTTILFQAKHSIFEKGKDEPKNLTSLDKDLWKTLSNWTDMIKADSSRLSHYLFCLVTNKGAGNNSFITAHSLFSQSNNIDGLFEEIRYLRDKTTDHEIKAYIKNVSSLGKKAAINFFSRLSLEVNTAGIIDLVKNKIFECIKNKDLVDAVFNSLSANMAVSKYLEIEDRKKFEISFEDFSDKFGKCFKVAFSNKPLPKRSFNITLPTNLNEQTFIRQLLDIGELELNSPKIITYTTQMLEATNLLYYWAEDNFILPMELQEFVSESKLRWENEFISKYRKIKRQIDSGAALADLDLEIQDLGIELVDFIRREKLVLAGSDLETGLCNGHFYALSDKPEIGWHLQWEHKYKDK